MHGWLGQVLPPPLQFLCNRWSSFGGSVWKALSLRINVSIWHLQWWSNQAKILDKVRNSAVSQCLQVLLLLCVFFLMPLDFALPSGLLLSQNRFPRKNLSTRLILKPEWQGVYVFNWFYVPTNKLVFSVFDFWASKAKRRGNEYQKCGFFFFMFCQSFL